MTLTVLFICIGFLVAGIAYWAISARQRGWRHATPEPFCIDSSTVCLQGIRYARPKAPPLVLIHGYAANSRSWRELGYALHANGYDIWMVNFRGHGKGTHRSTAKTEQPGAYGFKYVVAEDLPLIVEHVFKCTKKKCSIIGHSMGGMAAKLYLSGVTMNDDRQLRVDPDQAASLAKTRVQKLVLIGTPSHFHHLPGVIKWFSRLFPELSSVLQAAVLAPVANQAPTDPDKDDIISKFRRKILLKVAKADGFLTSTKTARMIINPANFNHEKDELPRFLEKSLSKVPADLVRNVTDWSKTGDAITEDNFNFSEFRDVHVPLLFIAGEDDGIGLASDIFTEARLHQGKTPVRTVLIRKTSHADLISGERAARLTGGVVLKFLKNPKSLGPDGSHESVGDEPIK